MGLCQQWLVMQWLLVFMASSQCVLTVGRLYTAMAQIQ